MTTSYITLALAWASFYALHSLLASLKFKEGFGWSAQQYRIFYNLVALGSLTAVLVLHIDAPVKAVFETSIFTKVVGAILLLYGAFVQLRVFQTLSIREFLGIRAERAGDLITTSIYQHLRHPIYFAVILLFAGLFLLLPTLPNAISLVVTLCYLPIGIYLEEQKLLTHFGTAYENYRHTVPSIFPKSWIR